MENKPIIILGEPGAGKTAIIEHAAAIGLETKDIICVGIGEETGLTELDKMFEEEPPGLLKITRPPALDTSLLKDFKYSELSNKEKNAEIQPVRTEPKISRNSPCPCGSGLKYKKCCINK